MELYETPYLLDVQEISGSGICVTGGSCDGDGDTDGKVDVNVTPGEG